MTTERRRVFVDISEDVETLLDRVSSITGVSRQQILAGALLEALPGLVERAEALRAMARAGVRPAPVKRPAARPGPADVLDGYVQDLVEAGS